MDVIPFLFFFGAAQGAFLAVALFQGTSENRLANRYLAAYLFLLSIELFAAGLVFHGTIQAYPVFRILISPYAYLQGPALYSYCRELTLPGTRPSMGARIALWGPPFVYTCLAWPQVWLHRDIQIAMVNSSEGLPPFFELWRWLLYDTTDALFALHFFVFLLLSLRLLIKHQVFMRATRSSLQHVSLNWLRLILMATVFVYVIWFFQMLTLPPDSPLSQRLDLMKGTLLVLLTYTLGWLGYKQPGIFATVVPDGPPAGMTNSDTVGLRGAPASSSPATASTGAPAAEKYARSALSPDMAKALLEEAEQLMSEHKLFLQPNLSLHELASSMQVSTNYLSQAINQQRKISFFDFVNAYRVDEAAEKLTDPSVTILQAGLDAGFNSKSAFYTAFRKHQGMTPGAFRKRAEAA